MRHLTSTALCVISLLGWASAARASDPLVDASVAPVPDIVTVSRPADTPPTEYFAAYEVRIVNNSKNTLNHVRFTASTVVKVPDPLQAGQYVPLPGVAAPFVEALGAACSTVAGNASAIECQLGTLRSRGGTTAAFPFTLLFRSPPAGAIIELSWQAFYSEGTKDNLGAAHGDGTDVGAAITTLGTPLPLEVRTYVPTGGGSFFTGNGVATKFDPWTTTVSVPRSARAEVVESVNAQSCGADYNLCVVSSLRIPGEFTYLEITLRRDRSTLVSRLDGAGNPVRPDIANAVLYYQSEVLDPVLGWIPVGTPVLINACNAQTGMPNGTEKRCIFSRRDYILGVPFWDDMFGDWEFVLRALENGKVSW